VSLGKRREGEGGGGRGREGEREGERGRERGREGYGDVKVVTLVHPNGLDCALG
jgi:hypothetical protein